MVRVFIKGGVWKNSEDEILKAAIMKYGKQQWARVASLLNRKSAKQCKARWNEWLDPSIRKVEWSRAEDEKLLHLAKLMPAQWKTIGPLVGGRTAVQSQERYETLLDQAASASGAGGEDNDAEGEEGMASSARKLRTGDIDPHPETKPARPDPIDMDEDEIEMLQEARARLANTQGKKAKRKAREKMLNEAKRLADLQKRRELKQAGLLSSAARTKMLRGKKRRREIDYGTEIPFHKPAPAGFHSTGEEDERADIQRSKRMKEIDFKKINEAQYRSRDREEKSAQRKEEARLRALEKSNMQYVVAEVSKKNDPIAARKRGILSMPAPSVTDEELEKVAKLTKEQRADNSAILSSSTGGSATDALLGDYSDRPLPTPMRTPMSNGPSSQEVIMREASNLRMLERGQTPLLGGDNPSFGEADGGGLGNFPSSGAATPMIGGTDTPMINGGKSIDRTSINATPMSVSNRDQLGLNRPTSALHPGMDASDDVSISATSFATSVGDHSMSIKEIARAERRAAKRARKELEIALANLPAPQFEYELAIPEAVTDDERDNTKMIVEKDAAEVEAEELARLEREAAKLYAKRSSVVKRFDLPRPIGAIDDNLVFKESDSSGEKSIDIQHAHDLIDGEMLELLQHDAFNHPYVKVEDDVDAKKLKKDKKGKKKSKKANVAPDTSFAPPPTRSLEYFDEEALDEAASMLDAELESVIQDKRSMANEANMTFESDNAVKLVLQGQTIHNCIQSALDQVYVEKKDKSDWVTSSSNVKSGMHTEYSTIKDSIDSIRKRADKLESKLTIKNGGYTKRAAAMLVSMNEDFANQQNSAIDEHVFSSLMQYEKRGIQSRIEKLQEEKGLLETQEASLQKKYGDLLHERNRHKLFIRQKENQDTHASS